MSCIELYFLNFAQDKDTKEVIILQTSDVHSRIEPVNQKGTNTIIKVVFFAGLLFSNSSAKEHKNVLLFDCGDISRNLIIICSAEKWKLN